MHPVTVYLVGAGPGDPDLLTLAGAAALRKADVVVYDYLANPRLLDLAPATAQRIYVGKSAGAHTLTQEQINQLLVDKARELQQLETGNSKLETRSVVRLKGGDPYVFGRGGEEAETLQAAGIPFVVIPGITSGIAAPNYAGIPVTHRDFATTLTLVTGHEKSDADPADDRVDFSALAKLAATGTICFYMGVKALPSLTQKLIASGLDPTTPAAVIRWGTHPHQKTAAATVGTIVDEVRRLGITAPAMTIIGKVVSLRPTLNWFESRPLFGQTILVTRTRQQASELSAGFLSLGANVIEAPTIDLVPPLPEDWPAIDEALMHLPAYDWVVFTSANGVRAAWDRLRHLGFDARHFSASEVAAIGPATAEVLNQIGIYPDLIPEKFVGEELAAALRTLAQNQKSEIKNQRFLLLRADIARPVLREELLKAGAAVDDLPIYRTIRPPHLPPEALDAISAGKVDWITFTSASTANNFFDLTPPELHDRVAAIKKLSIGPITTAALEKLSWNPALEAAQHDIPGMLAALQAYRA